MKLLIGLSIIILALSAVELMEVATKNLAFPQVPEAQNTIVMADGTKCAIYPSAFRNNKVFVMLCNDDTVRVVADWIYESSQ